MTGSPDVARYIKLGEQARDVAELARHSPALYDGQTALLETLATLIDHLVDSGDIDALALLVSTYGTATREAQERYEVRRRHEDESYAEAVRRHRLAINVACPYCGAEPGSTCRTHGPNAMSYSKGVHDHVGRYRAAIDKQGDEATEDEGRTT